MNLATPWALHQFMGVRDANQLVLSTSWNQGYIDCYITYKPPESRMAFRWFLLISYWPSF